LDTSISSRTARAPYSRWSSTCWRSSSDRAHLADGQVEHGVEHGLEPGRHLLDRSDVGRQDADCVARPGRRGVVAVDHEREVAVAHGLAMVGRQLAMIPKSR
jgi:hypothetical protein